MARYWNALVHFRGSDGYTRAEHEHDKISMNFQDFNWGDPEDILPKDRGHLMRILMNSVARLLLLVLCGWKLWSGDRYLRC